MRIALIAEDYYPQRGGVPEHVHHLAGELNRRGHSATIVTSHMRNAGPDPGAGGPRVRPLPHSGPTGAKSRPSRQPCSPAPAAVAGAPAPLPAPNAA